MTNEIVKQTKQLPSTIKELSQFILIGKERLKLYRTKLNAVNRLNLAKDVRERALEDSQNMGSALLWAESKMGELLKVIPPKRHGLGSKGGTSPSLPEGITKKQSHNAQQLFENQDLIDETIQEAIENEDIPTRTEVFRKKNDLQREEKYSKMQSQPLPKGIYNVIYCDPPWQYDNSGFQTSSEKQYPTMSIEQLRELDINKLSNENCILFMWATNPMLEDALNVMNQWGFKYKTNLVWVKKSHIQGFYVIGRHELLLIGIKGKMMPLDYKPDSTMFGKNIKHSQKPEETYEIIEKMFPKSKYIELFARNKRKGWDSWGNEV